VPEEAVSQEPTNQGKLSLTERRNRVALGVKAGKSNRAIAKELGVDEGTVRRDRKFLLASEAKQPAKLPSTKLRKLKRPLPARDHEVEKSQELDAPTMIESVELWIKEEHMVLEEIEYVLHEAAKRLHFGRQTVRSIPVLSKSPSELVEVARPINRHIDEIIPGPDFWADWLARWLALCFPRQEELQNEVLRETGIRARS
jgi:transposase